MNKHCAHLLTGSLATGLLPPYVLKAVVDAKWRRGITERLGEGAWNTLGESVDSIWFHAASVGEVGGLAPVLQAIREEYPSEKIVLSTTSTSGREEALKREVSDATCLLPFDHPWIVSRVLDKFSPRLMVITETEIWPNLLFALQGREIPAVVINGRISDYSFPKYRKIRSLLKPLWSSFEFVLAQSEIDRQRFVDLGMSSDRVVVAGSTKYDRAPVALSKKELASIWDSYGLQSDNPCFVAGSVREIEDELLIRAYCRARKKFPQLQLIIAPRHPERFDAVAQLLSKHDLVFSRRSAQRPLPGSSVMLLDTIGELSQAYALASLAFVGGSLVNIGGHNPLEPAAFSVPVIVGPYTVTVRDAVFSLKTYGGLREVDSLETLAGALVELLSDAAKAKAVGEAAFRAWQQNLGATNRVLERLRPLISS